MPGTDMAYVPMQSSALALRKPSTPGTKPATSLRVACTATRSTDIRAVNAMSGTNVGRTSCTYLPTSRKP
eukprot:1557399-Rhodomonas_salina.1